MSRRKRVIIDYVKDVGLLASVVAVVLSVGKLINYGSLAALDFKVRLAYAQIECAVDEVRKISEEYDLASLIPPPKELFDPSIGPELRDSQIASEEVRRMVKDYKKCKSEIEYLVSK